jgi:hypothetical protein
MSSFETLQARPPNPPDSMMQPDGALLQTSQARRFSAELGRTSYHLDGVRWCAIYGKTGGR